MPLPGFPRITIDPAICGGRPTITGTRMRVTDILEALAADGETDELLADFPYICAADIREALAYAATIMEHPVSLAAE